MLHSSTSSRPSHSFGVAINPGALACQGNQVLPSRSLQQADGSHNDEALPCLWKRSIALSWQRSTFRESKGNRQGREGRAQAGRPSCERQHVSFVTWQPSSEGRLPCKQAMRPGSRTVLPKSILVALERCPCKSDIQAAGNCSTLALAHWQELFRRSKGKYERASGQRRPSLETFWADEKSALSDASPMVCTETAPKLARPGSHSIIVC